MFDVGEKVVCVNDDFPSWVHQLYTGLPKKGVIYTVRGLDIGRAYLFSTVKGGNETSYVVYLEEILNPDDPRVKNRKVEMGFRSDRFRSLETQAQTQATEEEIEERILAAL